MIYDKYLLPLDISHEKVSSIPQTVSHMIYHYLFAKYNVLFVYMQE